MDPDFISRNTKASGNGFFCEEYARRVLPDLEWVDGVYDAVLNGVPLDIKSCEAWYKRYDMPNSKRKAGMMTLKKDQDSLLKKQNGLYFCVVHIGELVINSFIVPAVRVPQHRQVSWTTMQKLAEAV